MSCDPLYDFDYFYAASSCLQQGSSPFGPCLNDELRELQHQDWRFARLRFLPVALYLIYPLAWTSRHLAAFAVTLVMLLCLWRSAALLADSLPLATRRLWIFGLALLFFPVLKSFYFGQISPLLLWVLLEARHRKGACNRRSSLSRARTEAEYLRLSCALLPQRSARGSKPRSPRSCSRGTHTTRSLVPRSPRHTRRHTLSLSAMG